MTTPKALLRALETRDGHRSAWTGRDVPELVPQHRQGGMGGGKSKHRIANLLWLESEINGLIESDANFAAEARRRGIKISIHDDPSTVPVLHHVHGGLVRLADDGTVEAVMH
jgi:hypothetical protein